MAAFTHSLTQPARTELLLLPDLQGDELQPVPWGGDLGCSGASLCPHSPGLRTGGQTGSSSWSRGSWYV